jgi:hypothetical protein
VQLPAGVGAVMPENGLLIDWPFPARIAGVIGENAIFDCARLPDPPNCNDDKSKWSRDTAYPQRGSNQLSPCRVRRLA